MTADQMAAVVQALGTLGAALADLGAVDGEIANDARAHLAGLTRSLDALTAQGLEPSPRRPATVVDLAARRARRGRG